MKKDDSRENNKKLREFLSRLDEYTCDEDYKETDLYKLGFEDGETMGYEVASQRFQDELRGLRTMINALIDSK